MFKFLRRRWGIVVWRKQKSLIFRLHPPQIPASAAKFTYTFGLGGLAILATLLALITGLLLMFYYLPTPDNAHASLTYINSVVWFGGFVRSLHYWSAQAMVVLTVLHLARVVFTGGYRPPRDFNWFLGLGLLIVVLLWDFTGYVLRWDSNSIRAMLTGTNLLKTIPGIGTTLYRLVVGDIALGQNALLRFYAWHVLGLAAIGIGGTIYHLWRIRVDGGISHPVPGPAHPRVFVTRETLFFQELIAALIATSLLIGLSVALPPALGPQADLSAVEHTVVKAPWFFLAIQELLRYLPPLWAGWIIPLLGLALLAAIPLIDRQGPGRGEWFSLARIVPQLAFILLLAVIIGLTLIAAFRR